MYDNTRRMVYIAATLVLAAACTTTSAPSASGDASVSLAPMELIVPDECFYGGPSFVCAPSSGFYDLRGPGEAPSSPDDISGCEPSTDCPWFKVGPGTNRRQLLNEALSKITCSGVSQWLSQNATYYYFNRPDGVAGSFRYGNNQYFIGVRSEFFSNTSLLANLIAHEAIHHMYNLPQSEESRVKQMAESCTR